MEPLRMVRSFGIAETAKLGAAVTVTVTVAVWEMDPLVAVTVTL